MGLAGPDVAHTMDHVRAISPPEQQLGDDLGRILKIRVDGDDDPPASMFDVVDHEQLERLPGERLHDSSVEGIDSTSS